MRPPGRFFTHGEVRVLQEDPESGDVALLITLPSCVMQAVTPQLLAAGLVDSLEVRQPVAAWVPTVEDAGFAHGDAGRCSTANVLVRNSVKAVLDAYGSVSRELAFPGDILPMLPMGTYVQFRLRCPVARLAEEVGRMGGAAGVRELQAAFASVVGPLLSRTLARLPSPGAGPSPDRAPGRTGLAGRVRGRPASR